MRLHLLALLAKEPAHGYELKLALEQTFGEAYPSPNIGQIYVTLKRLEIKYSIAEGRFAWLQIAKGSVELNGHLLKQGDGAAINEEQELTIYASEHSEVLLFDLA